VGLRCLILLCPWGVVEGGISVVVERVGIGLMYVDPCICPPTRMSLCDSPLQGGLPSP